MSPDFLDTALVHVAGGDGGHGCVAVRRERYRPLAGPDGGNGGHGGDVVLVVDPSVTTLLEHHRRPHQRAGSGKPGQGSRRDGAAGADLVLPVPDGTLVSTPDGTPLADLVGQGSRFVVAAGGRGGLGNRALASRRRPAPGFALLGEPGERRDVLLQLKLVADAGLVGLPNAGKSSLISAMSAARPKVADYPFTTVQPHLGVVSAGDTVFTMADVPGLVPGASRGRGLGLRFLRHVERCAVLVHVVDCAADDRDPVGDVDTIEAELAAHGGLADRPRLVALNKTDVPAAAATAARALPELARRGLWAAPVSAATGAGLPGLAYAVAAAVRAARAAAVPPSTRRVWRPRPVDPTGFTVQPSGDGFVVKGERPERWVRQTDFGNDEAVGYLADRLARLGVETRLAELGAPPHAQVTIGEVSFEWDPATPAGGRPALGPRGRDPRLVPAGRRATRA